MTKHVGVQRAASYPFDQWTVSQLLSTSNPLGERAFPDRPGYALRQGSRCHALKIRSWPSPLETASSRFAEYTGLSRVRVAAVPSLAARAHLPPSARSVVPKIATFVRSGRLAVAPGGDT
jgi:hypothetical protein